jgi:hypothetical protein
MSALDKLNALNAAMETSEDKKPQERPTMPVPPAALAAFVRLVPALRILKIAEARKEIEEGIISDEMMMEYSNILWNLGSRPTNPRLQVKKADGRPDLSGLFQVQEKWKLEYEKGEAPAAVRIAAALVRAGFSQIVADTIVKNEISTQPLTTLSKPLNELAVGTDLEKSAAEKLIGLAFGERVEPLTAQERAVALKKVENVEVKDGILQRIKQYCSNAQQLRMLFRVIKPVHFVSHAKYGESDTEEERTQRLATEALELVKGTKVPEKEKKS